jgi:hypothetical protein
MTEFVLALPLLLAVLALMLLVGWSMMRKQRVVVASRYAVWRHLEGETPSDDALNERLLNRAAEDVQQDHAAGPGDAVDLWVETADDLDPAAGELADRLLGGWPKGRQTSLAVEYAPPLRTGKQFGREMGFRHGREGGEWTRRQAAEWQTLAELYCGDLEEYLTSVDESGQPLAETIRGLYIGNW